MSDEPVLCNLVCVSKGTPFEFYSTKGQDIDCGTEAVCLCQTLSWFFYWDLGAAFLAV